MVYESKIVLPKKVLDYLQDVMDSKFGIEIYNVQHTFAAIFPDGYKCLISFYYLRNLTGIIRNIESVLYRPDYTEADVSTQRTNIVLAGDYKFDSNGNTYIVSIIGED